MACHYDEKIAMIHKVITILLTMMISNCCFGQDLIPKNLVPNPSFEQFMGLPLRHYAENYFEHEPLSGYIPFNRNVVFWKTANVNTPDLRYLERKHYSDCQKEFDYCVKARTGKAMTGIITYMSNYSTDTYREYITVRLREPVKAGIKTFVELWVCKSRRAKLVSNNIGCYFSQRSIKMAIRENLPVNPQVNCSELMNADGQEWIKISGEFIPAKDYIYLTIGNFYDNTATQYQDSEHYAASPKLEKYALYLVDDVRVWQENDSLEYNVQKKKPVRLDDIHFETNSAKLLATSLDELNKLRTFLTNNPTIKIAIQGHTDDRGEEGFNLKLSEARAKAVVTFLKQQGIASNRLTAIGYGETKPIISNQSEAGRLKNRRVEFVVLE